jgi:multiple sugar transport system permease protein
VATLEASRQTPVPAVGATPERPSARRWWLYLLLTLGLALTVIPFVWMLAGSFKTQRELLQATPSLIPEEPTTANFERFWDRLNLPRFFWNSFFIAAMITLTNLLFCSMVGYALAKLRFAGRNVLFALVLGTLLVPSTVVLVPLFVLMAKLELVDTPWAVILPVAAGPLGVFLMRQFMLGIPDELLDAARVDGAREFTIFWRVVLPISLPALAALGIVTFLPAWNALLWPLVVLTSQENYTLPVALAIFSRGQFSADYGLLMAGSVALVVPVVVVFLVLQRQFTQSVTMTGIKG